MASKRTPQTGETLPVTVVTVAPSNSLKKVQIKLICPTCAFEYCPNALSYARPDIAITGVTLDKKQPCDYCHARSQTVGVTDPANYGGIGAVYEK